MTRDLLDGLDDGQRAAVLAPSGPVCVLAGAGTGKTRTITHRIAHLVASGAHPVSEVLAVTFTTRAAGEMRLRLRSLGVPGVQARTFHSAALRQLRYFWPRAVGGTLWPVLEQKLRVVAIAARRAGVGTDAATLRDLAGEIEWAKASLAGPDTYGALAARTRRETPLPAEQVAKVFAIYESAKQEAEQLDFDDLLLHTCAVLETDDEVAREFRGRYRCFVVDEYQDVTPLQQRLLDAWLGERDQLTVVGDANQTIYSFAGASPGYLLGFERRYPNASVVRLERDYRSTPQVVSLANRVIAASVGGDRRYRLRLTAVLPDGPEATFAEHPDEPAEAAAVAGPGRRADRRRHPGRRHRRALPDQRAVRGLRGRLQRRRRAVRAARRPAVLRPRRGAAGDRRAAHGGQPGGRCGRDRRRREPGTRGACGADRGRPDRHPATVRCAA